MPYTPPSRAEIGAMSLEEARTSLAQAQAALDDLEAWRVAERDRMREIRERIVATNPERDALIEVVARLQKMVHVRGAEQRVTPLPATLNAAGV